MLNRRQFANVSASGDYAVPSAFNPPVIDPRYESLRSDLGPADWQRILDDERRKEEADNEDKSQEKNEEQVKAASGDYSYVVLFGVLIGLIWFVKKRGV